MNFSELTARDLLQVLPHEITRLNPAVIDRAFRTSNSRRAIELVVNRMGEASAVAQNLRGGPVTTFGRLMCNPNQRLYLMRSANIPGNTNGQKDDEPVTVLAMLKVGPKKLFVMDTTAKHNEMEPLSVLDFYVHESVQRHGHGRRLFQFMLDVCEISESVEARSLAYDKPSDKFLPFLARHFNLRRFIPQANNYVVFLDHPTLQEAAREHALAQQAASGRGRPRHVPVGSRNQEAAAAAVTNDTTGGESAPVDVATQQAARRSAASQYFANQIIWPGDPRSNFDLPLPRRYGQDRLGGADRNGADGLTPLRLVTADLPSVRTSFAEEEAAERARRQVAASQAVEEHVMEQKSSRQLFDVEKVLDNVRRKLHPETEVNLRYERFIVDNNGKAIDGRGR